MSSANDDRRSFSRITFDAETSITQDGKRWPVELIDISLKGLLIRQPKDWAVDPDQTLTAEIALSEENSIKMRVHWRHSDSDCIGFECETIDIDSISHLRRLVELNLGDTDLLERELDALQH